MTKLFRAAVLELQGILLLYSRRWATSSSTSASMATGCRDQYLESALLLTSGAEQSHNVVRWRLLLTFVLCPS